MLEQIAWYSATSSTAALLGMFFTTLVIIGIVLIESNREERQPMTSGIIIFSVSLILLILSVFAWRYSDAMLDGMKKPTSQNE